MQINNLKFAFFGTPEVASETLEILKERGLRPTVIITSPDKPVGRKQIITPPPVKVWAQKNNIPVIQPDKLDEKLLSVIQSYDIELFLVVAFGKIFTESFINYPKYGTINIHYSLLPKYRGAAPVQYAILNGDKETGVTIQKMVKELDAGPIIASEKIAIEDTTRTPELLARLICIGADLFAETLPLYLNEKIELKKQDENAISLAPKIKKEDGLVDLSDDAIRIYNKFRAFTPWPRVYYMKDGKRVIITDCELSDGKLIIKKIIPEGGSEITFNN